MTIRLERQVAVMALLVGVSCGGSRGAVRPDEMSEEAHRQEAARVQAAARDEQQRSTTPRVAPNLAATVGSNPQGYSDPADDANKARAAHAVRAHELSAHAREHERAAGELQGFEQAECKDLAPVVRAACPLLGPLVDITDVPGGIRARFAAGTDVDAVAAQMRCHFAYAQKRGFGKAAGCPLYVRGVQIREVRDPLSIEITARDRKMISEIRSRAREQAVLVHADAE